MPNWSRLHAKQDYSWCYSLLDSLAGIALQSNDVPIAACLFRDDQLVGKGYNTVQRHQNIAGHAEINALNDAVQRMGLDSFKRLDKSKMKLLTTFEPCEMCKGALVEYGITRVISVLGKSAKDRSKSRKMLWQYQVNARLADHPRFQYDLFLRHPEFDTLVYPFR